MVQTDNEVMELIKERETNLNVLNQSTNRIKDWRRNTSQNIWNIGAELNNIKDTKSYLFKYDTFENYLKNELDFSRTSAYSFMQIALTFDVQTLGLYESTSKIQLLATLEEEKRKEFTKDRNIENISHRELKQEIKRIKSNLTEDEQFFVDFITLAEKIKRDMDILESKWIEIKNNRQNEFNKYRHRDRLIELKKEILR